MAITQAMCNSFKGGMLTGVHNFASSGGDTFKLALYTSSANLDATTTAYTVTGESSGANYTAGGSNLTNSGVTTGATSFTSFSNLTFTNVTLTARGAMIYNNTDANAAVCVLDFGADKVVSPGDLQIVFPTANATSAIIRVG
jgi:hypothetical protein